MNFIFLQWVRLVLLVCLLAGAFSSTAEEMSGWPVPFEQQRALQLDGRNHVALALGTGIRYLETQSAFDRPSALSAVPASDWQINHSRVINLGYQRAAYWFVQDLRTSDDIAPRWRLELSNTMVDDIQVFLVQGGVTLAHWHTGDAFPFSQRPIQAARFVFPLTLQPSQHYQLYFRIQNTEAMELPLLLLDSEAYSAMQEQRAMVDGIFHGFLLIMAAYSLALYLNLRDSTYLCYVAYVTSMLLFFLSQQGLLYQHVFPASPWWQHYSAAWVSLLIFSSVAVFFRQFLRLHEHLPRIWGLYVSLLVVHVLSCVALLYFDYYLVIQVMAIVAGLSSFLGVVAIVRLALAGSRSARIVLIGWTILITFVILFVLAKLGVFYNDFLASYGLRIGFSFEILIFSFALSFRINEERKEKEWALQNINRERAERIRAQELALQREMEASQVKEQALQMERGHRESLQQQVAERTADLERTLENLEKVNAELEQLSARDSLTGLYNRRYFNTRLEENWQSLARKGEPLSLLIIDIDHFKQINDQWGHLCGDFVLNEFSTLLKSLLHRPCDVIARYGGEEFAVLLPSTPADGAAHLAEIIVAAAAAHDYVWQSRPLHVTVSVGIETTIPGSQEAAERLVARADTALYRAKQNGRNRVASYAGMAV